MVCEQIHVFSFRFMNRVLSFFSRRLAFAALDWTRPKDPPISLGQASIVAELQRREIDVKPRCWSINSPTFSPHEVFEWVMDQDDGKTDFAIGAYVWNETATQSILGRLHERRFRGRVILGGPQVSYCNRGLESYYPTADIFIRGYAEQALAKLMVGEKNIAGVHYRNEPDLGLSARCELEKLASPFLTGSIAPQWFLRWETQRGW
jgi:hypothetical protein